MDRQDEIYQQILQNEKEQKRKARKEKWKAREKKFWKAFLFTEDGKPKSGLVIYTLFLSFGLIAVYFLGFYLTTQYLTGPLSGLNAALGNLIQSALVGLLGGGVSAILHKVISDKRMMFRTHLWLVAFVLVCIVVLCFMLGGDWGDIRAMLTFALWFAVIPVAIGILITYPLYRRDYLLAPKPEEAPPWKKYTERR